MLHGAVIEIRGNPMPGGGYVATFTDVTRFRQTEAALKRINETLEQRVEARTHELALATRAAEQANEAKGYFLAAVSHDLLQPLHAAQLFSQTLQESLKAQKKTQVAEHLINALDVTETLDRKSTRLNSSHVAISYAVFCLIKKQIDHLHL